MISCSKDDNSSAEGMTYVPDDGFEQLLISEGYDDVMDNYVQTANITVVEGLCNDNYTINDLTGIEDFKNLKTFCLWNGDFESPDFSNNKELEILKIRGSFSEINLRENLKLKDLEISRSKLSTIDLSNNLALEKLLLYDGNITTINLEYNVLLTNISIFETPLQSLNLNQNTKVTNLGLSNNELVSLEISELSELETLTCRENNLSELYVQNNFKLTSLFCSNNNLQAINLTGNTLLEHLYIKENPLNCIEVNEMQIAAIPNEWYKDDSAEYSINCN